MRIQRSVKPFVSAFFALSIIALPISTWAEEPASTACPSAPSNGAAPVCVMTYHNSNSRTGLNPNEKILTAPKIQTGLTSFTDSVAGQVYAQPLFLPQIKMLTVSRTMWSLWRQRRMMSMRGMATRLGQHRTGM